MQKAANAYLQTSVSTTSQGEILLMLYDGAIKFLRQAQEQIKAKEYAQKGILISKALDILAELESSLNTQKGGEIASNLHKLYFFCQTKLLQANLKMDVELVEEVIKILDGLRSAYAEVVKGAPQPSAPATAGASMPSPRPAAPAPAAATAPGQGAAPDQNALLSASFWLQKGTGAGAPAPSPAASPGAAPATSPAPAPSPVPTPATPPLQAATPPPAEQPATTATVTPISLAASTMPAQGQPASPGATKRLAGSKLYQKMAKTP